MLPSIPLLLKLAAVAITGAAALLEFRRIHREDTISSLRREICDVLGRDSDTRPPTVLVTGPRGHGRSSFINTACRALGGEVGPVLVLRAATAPPGPATPNVARSVVMAAAADGEAVELVDAPPLTRVDVEEALEISSPECVVVVFRCGGKKKERRELVDIATVARERGLHLVVVLTHKKSLKTKEQAEELRREVAARARTDCVYFIENYTASDAIDPHHLIAIKNDFDTHFTVLAIIRQCIEFALVYRMNQLSRKTRDPPKII